MTEKRMLIGCGINLRVVKVEKVSDCGGKVIEGRLLSSGTFKTNVIGQETGDY